MRENKKYKIKNISRRNTASTSWPYRGTGVEHPSFTSDRLPRTSVAASTRSQTMGQFSEEK